MKNKLRVLFIVCAIALSLSESKAQGFRNNDGKGKEEIESYKVGFITRRLNLTPEEAKVFWPVYDQFQNEIGELRKKHRHDLMDAKLNFESLSDSEIEKLVDGEIAFKQSELDVQKKYHAEFKRILKIRKLALLYKAQEDFKRELLNRIRDTNRHDNIK